MNVEQGFRCPFEIKGEREGTILYVDLPESRFERMKIMRHTLEQVHYNLNISAAKLRLPDSCQGTCTSNKALFPLVIPFQCELLALDLDMRLRPYLPYQIPKVPVLNEHKPTGVRFYHLMTASAFSEAYFSGRDDFPKNEMDILEWLQAGMLDAWSRGIQRPTLKFAGPVHPNSTVAVPLLEIHLSSAVILSDRFLNVGDPKTNLNLYSLVMTPFYPESFGRYSKDVHIMVGREADFDKVSASARTAMRRASNTVLKKAGVVIKNIDDDKQDSGLWIPRYRPDRRRPSS